MESNNGRSRNVCQYWRQGKCNRNPCRFLHADAPPQNPPNHHGGPLKWERCPALVSMEAATQIKQNKLCRDWIDGKCRFGDSCKYQHRWSDIEGITMLKDLPGHEKAISGISLPTGTNKLFSGSKDGTVRTWDSQTAQCAGIVNLGSEVGSAIAEGPWLFVGVTNAVKARNTQTNAELSLDGPVGQVNALVVGKGMLFAGCQDGNILAWRFNDTANVFEPAVALRGHTLPVVTLVVGGNNLYSGSTDTTIRVWDTADLQCFLTLTEHASAVMSVLCWEQYLLSCSLDRTVKLWAATETGSLEAVYTHKEEHGVVTLCGRYDSESKPVLLCSCNDNVVRVYDLPSFNERGKIFSEDEVRDMLVAPGGLIFTGDGAGKLRVWNWSDKMTR